MPVGLEITPSGLIRGVPSKPGDYSFGLRVDDSQGNAAGATFTTSFVDPLRITTDNFQNFLVGDFFDQELTASGGNPPYSWDLLTGKLPEGISLTDSRISGFSSNTSTSDLTIGLSDSAGKTIEKDFFLEIVDPVVIATKTIDAATSGSDYSFLLEASGGSEPYQWSISEGELPFGLEMSENGVIQGLPEVATLSPVAVTVTDASGRSNTRNFDIFVSVGQEIQTIAARGGTIKVEIKDNILRFIESISNDSFVSYVVSNTNSRVQVHFIGGEDQWPSWVLCESYPEPNCSFD